MFCSLRFIFLLARRSNKDNKLYAFLSLYLIAICKEVALSRKYFCSNQGHRNLIKNKTNSSDKHIELVQFDYDLTYGIYSTYIFQK